MRCDAMGLGDFVELDLSIVRGLAYYTGTVFELFDAERRAARHLRRRALRQPAGALGGVDLPALGFGMGDVVLARAAEGARACCRRPTPAVDVFLVARDPDGPPARALASPTSCATRGSGWSTRSAPQALGKQLKLADARGARLRRRDRAR